MTKQYYVQLIADNYLKNVINDPVTIKVHDKFLYGLDKDEFQEGFFALLALIRNLYNDIVQSPANFGMLLKEIIDIDAKDVDYTNSNASFLRVPNLLLVFGAYSEIQSDMSLSIDGNVLSNAAKELKITGLPLLCSKLNEYGFEISGINKTIKTGDIIKISYTDNKFLTAALKAMADALLEMNKGDIKKSKNYFYMMHNEILINEKVKEPKLTIESIYHALDPAAQENAAALHESVAGVTKQAVRMGGFMRNDWSCVYTGNKNKKVLMSLQVNQQTLSVKLNLQHIGEYMSLVAEQPEKIREAIQSNGWNCGNCNPGCSGAFSFEMDGKTYNKCRCGSFVFNDITMKDVTSFKKLLNKELTYQS